MVVFFQGVKRVKNQSSAITAVLILNVNMDPNFYIRASIVTTNFNVFYLDFMQICNSIVKQKENNIFLCLTKSVSFVSI